MFPIHTVQVPPEKKPEHFQKFKHFQSASCSLMQPKSHSFQFTNTCDCWYLLLWLVAVGPKVSWWWLRPLCFRVDGGDKLHSRNCCQRLHSSKCLHLGPRISSLAFVQQMYQCILVCSIFLQWCPVMGDSEIACGCMALFNKLCVSLCSLVGLSIARFDSLLISNRIN